MYQAIILPKAFEDLSKIDKTVSKRITDKLTWLSENAEAIMPLPLGGKYSSIVPLFLLTVLQKVVGLSCKWINIFGLTDMQEEE